MTPVLLVAVIGLVCAGLAAVGLYIGSSLTRAAILKQRDELLGGLVLIGIGLKILVEHHAFG
jgi:putative Mn2+ efflux pump MntP